MRKPSDFARVFLSHCRRYEREGYPKVYSSAEAAYDELFPSYLPWKEGDLKEAIIWILRRNNRRLFESIRNKHGYDMVDSLLGVYKDL